MARLIQANILISDHGEDGFRIYGAVHFLMGVNVYAYDLDTYKQLKTGDPKINGQLEELILKMCEDLHRQETSDPYRHWRTVEKND